MSITQAAWKKDLVQDGYVRFSGLTPKMLVTRALQAIQNDLRVNYDVNRQTEYDNRSYCPDLCDTPVIRDLLVKSPIYGFLNDTLGIRNLRIGPGQIAIRRSRNHAEPVPPTPHLDGFATGLNGVPGDRIYNHTVLIGVFLTPVLTEFAGNFTVWPASHYVYERYFRERGNRAMHEPMPELQLGDPVQLCCDVGDVVLAHYSLGHTAAVNTSEQDRIAIFFRAVLSKAQANGWPYLTNIWDGWNL